jgi:molecular chaperone IbpA
MNQLSRLTTVDLPSLFANLHRSSIGFEQMFNDLNRTTLASTSINYPPYDIVKVNDANYYISVAVAGFKEEELSITLEKQVLTISGNQVADLTSDVEYLHRGISGRTFARTFTLAEHAVVRGAKYENGLLQVDVAIEVPETMKPKKIEIGTTKKLEK